MSKGGFIPGWIQPASLTILDAFPKALQVWSDQRAPVVPRQSGNARAGYRAVGGEHGIAAVNWSSLTSLQPKWLADKKLNIVGQFAMRPHKELTKVPMWLDIARTDADKQAMQLLLSRLESGRPFFLPPDVPAARVAALRRAFDATMKDAAFLAEAQKSKLEIDAMTGEELAAFVAKLAATPPEVVKRVKDALAGK